MPGETRRRFHGGRVPGVPYPRRRSTEAQKRAARRNAWRGGRRQPLSKIVAFHLGDHRDEIRQYVEELAREHGTPANDVDAIVSMAVFSPAPLVFEGESHRHQTTGSAKVCPRLPLRGSLA
jgi:hypothetical protein